MSQNHVAYLTPVEMPPTDHMDLAECFEDIKDFELLMRELADHVDSCSAKRCYLCEMTTGKLTFLRAEREGGAS